MSRFITKFIAGGALTAGVRHVLPDPCLGSPLLLIRRSCDRPCGTTRLMSGGQQNGCRPTCTRSASSSSRSSMTRRARLSTSSRRRFQRDLVLRRASSRGYAYRKARGQSFEGHGFDSSILLSGTRRCSEQSTPFAQHSGAQWLPQLTTQSRKRCHKRKTRRRHRQHPQNRRGKSEIPSHK